MEVIVVVVVEFVLKNKVKVFGILDFLRNKVIKLFNFNSFL